MGFKLAELFVDIRARDDELKKQVGGVKDQLTSFGVAIGTAVGSLAAAAIARAASALTSFISGGISGAIELEDSLSALGVIFGKNAGIISEEADRMAAKFGVVKGTFIDAASSFGASFKAIGTPTEDAAKLGNQLAKLGMDMASFTAGATNEEAFTALKAALRGEFDPLERFNVMLSAAAIEQEALSMGLIKSAKDMDEAAKKQATLSLIMKKSADQQGDLERTADSSKNAWSKFTGTVTNLAVEMGTMLSPAINSVIGLANEMLGSLSSAFEGSKAAFQAFSDGVVSIVQTIGVAWRNLPDLWEIVTIKAREMGLNLIEIFKVIPANLGIIGEYIANNWRQLITDGINAVGAVFTNLSTNIANLASAIVTFLSDPTKGFQFNWTPLLDGFQATADALPELAKPALVSLQEEIDQVAGRIADRESKRAQEIADKAKAASAPAKSVAAAAGKKTADFKSETSGISEFAVKLRESALSGKDDTPKKQLKQAELTAENTKKIAEALAGGIVAVLG